MLKAVFFSDLHLTTLEDERGRFFLKTLHSFQGPQSRASGAITHLFLVGDIFDLWLADHQFFIQAYAPVIDQIHRLQSQGVEVHYFEGNHDLYLTTYWQRALGVRVHGGPAFFQLGPWQVRVEHGDQVDPDDHGYRFLRWFLRTPVLRWLAHHLPGSVVAWLGRRASQSSRHYTSMIKTVSRDQTLSKLHRHAELAALTDDFDFLINGHVHVTDDYSFNAQGRRRRAINLGSWLEGQFGHLELTEKGAEWVLDRVN